MLRFRRRATEDRSDRKTFPTMVLIPLLALMLLATSCGSERSVEAFCATYREETSRLAEKYNQRLATAESQDGLGMLVTALGSLVEAQGDIVVLFDRLEKSAPEEIAPDVVAVRDALQKQADATASGDVVQMLFGGVVTALQSSGSANRVDTYLIQNCGTSQ